MKWYLIVLEKYFVFNGRARRSEYWYFILFHYLILFAFGLIGTFVKMPLLSSLYLLAVVVPSISAIVRRMHDVGKSGWFCLIPIYNIILACKEGDEGDNQYGSDPKAVDISYN